ncbi:MAG: hypothetical protein HY364_05310 [Candidatus Aenigmarchaeota archaeon]|nr:hypothetical protein [Candidatus Aenigmarchaeota archaeon]
MIFQKKSEMQEIKDALSQDNPSVQKYYGRENFAKEENRRAAAHEPVRTEDDAVAPPVKGSAPLFVKIDKYYDILKDLQEMKMFLAGTKHLYHVLEEVENVRNDTLKIMRATIQRLEKSVVEMDSGLLRPREDQYPTPQETPEVRHIEGSLNELQGQLDVLKKELQSMK